MDWFFWFIGIGLVVSIVAALAKSTEQGASKQAYLESLEKLKGDPTNADLRQETLRLGRLYSNSMRDDKGHTVFDELAVMNDISAATASAIVTRDTASATASSPSAKLKHLQELLDQKLITEDEFRQRRERVLQDL